MDEKENKDFLPGENSSGEENATDASENINEKTEALADTENTDLKNSSVQAAGAAPVKVKNNRVIQVPVIIAAAILVCAVLAFFAWKVFFNNSVVGTWVVQGSIATSDEASTDEAARNSATYYTFYENGKASLTVGTMEVSGTYEVTQGEDGTQNLSVSIYYYFTGEYTYTVSGNALTGRQLVLSNESQQTIAFESADKPVIKMEPSKDFEKNDDVTGTWNESDYNMTYTFNEDGTVQIAEQEVELANGETVPMLTVTGTYVIRDGVITVTYMTNEETTLDIEFSRDGDTLVLSGLGYTKVE